MKRGQLQDAPQFLENQGITQVVIGCRLAVQKFGDDARIDPGGVGSQEHEAREEGVAGLRRFGER